MAQFFARLCLNVLDGLQQSQGETKNISQFLGVLEVELRKVTETKQGKKRSTSDSKERSAEGFGGDLSAAHRGAEPGELGLDAGEELG